jgi:alcohol dehydrogenase class IV
MMIPNFSLQLVSKILFGAGSFDRLVELLKQLGRRPLFVVGKQSFLTSPYGNQLAEMLESCHCDYHRVQIVGEPTPETIDAIVDRYRNTAIDLIIGIGGGAVLDGGKAISAMLCENGTVYNFLEGVGQQTPSGKKLPYIAIPTTAGTGSETTSNAVISSVGKDGFKKSLRHENYMPNVALVDPRLTLGCPGEISGYCAMDCLTQLVEGFLSTKATPITDRLAVEGIRAVSRSLQRVVKDGQDLAARTDLSYGALLSGLVLTNAGLGTVHGFASVIGGRYTIPHAVVCGNLMAPTNRSTVMALRDQNPDHPALAKYSELGRIFAGHDNNNDAWYQDFFLVELERLTEDLAIPGLGGFGIRRDELTNIARQTGNKNNPFPLSPAQLVDILQSRMN